MVLAVRLSGCGSTWFQITQTLRRVYLQGSKLYMGSHATKKQKKETEICFTASSVQILEVRAQCVVVDMHIDQPLQKRKECNVKCANILVSNY